MTSDDRYDEDYYMRGIETGKSLYSGYTWRPDLTVPMVERMIDYLGICKSQTILDFGCARGYVVRAFRQLGYYAHGADVSEWAIRNADEEAKPYLTLAQNSICGPPLENQEFDWVIAKDVLEHVYFVSHVVSALMRSARCGVFAVVPLSAFDNGEYVIADYEKDVTHTQRWTLPTWAAMFLRPGWRVEASYRVPGIKDNWHKEGWEKGNGFIIARRIK